MLKFSNRIGEESILLQGAFKHRVGEFNTATNGQKMTIISYRGRNNIDIQFEDGTIVTNKTYIKFKKGEIRNPNYSNKLLGETRVGESNTSTNGQKMTITAYRSSKDIDIQFEDGTIVTNKLYRCFKNGAIRNPNFYNKFLGETSIASNGQKMTIVSYRGTIDIDIQFEDGTIVTNKTYKNFKLGRIGNPNYNPYESRLGEVGINNDGQKMAIISYRGCQDIDVQFEDGAIVTNRTYTGFKIGTIRNPNFYNKFLGETSIANNGLKMVIVAYRHSTDVDIQFEDGTIVCNKKYRCIRMGSISHPAIDTRYRGILKDHKLNGIAYRLNNKSVYYYCACAKCGKKDILSPQQILNHKCEE